MKLYYKAGACSLASHILLQEVGLPFTIESVDLETKRTHSGRDFKAINPKGYIPALELASGEVLTEGASILQYIADQKAETSLSPAYGTLERARLQEALNYISSELHKAFKPLFSETATEAEKKQAENALAQKFEYVSSLLSDGQHYVLGNHFTAADAYLFVVMNWCHFVGIDLQQWPNLEAYRAAMAMRPSVKAAMSAEGLL